MAEDCNFFKDGMCEVDYSVVEAQRNLDGTAQSILIATDREVVPCRHEKSFGTCPSILFSNLIREKIDNFPLAVNYVKNCDTDSYNGLGSGTPVYQLNASLFTIKQNSFGIESGYSGIVGGGNSKLLDDDFYNKLKALVDIEGSLCSEVDIELIQELLKARGKGVSE